MRFKTSLLTRADLAAAALLAVLPAFFFAGLTAGKTFFWGDLLYIHFPWKNLAAGFTQSGQLPLWNPYSYFGMPLAAQMQSACWHPGTLPFYFASFETGLKIFHAFHFALAGFLSFLVLRKEGVPRPAAFFGAALYMLGGAMTVRIPFLNHLAVLSLLPAFFLFRGGALLLAIALALGFLAGYPPMLVGGAALAFALSVLEGLRENKLFGTLQRWGAAAALAGAFSAVLLIPAAELVADSRRSSGVMPGEGLSWSFAWVDFLQFTAPFLTPTERYSALEFWWKTVYLGFFGTCAAAIGFFVSPWRVKAAAGAALACIAVLILGENAAVSAWVWEKLPLLRFVRYPGNLGYLSLPIFTILAALGAARLAPKAAWAAAFFLVGELSFYALRDHPTVPAPYFTQSGPLAEKLLAQSRGQRFLPSPRMLQSLRGGGADAAAAALDLRQRLFGLTSAANRLESAGGFGEPLVPRHAYAFMDHLLSLPSLDSAAAWMPWAGASLVLTKDDLPSRELERLGRTLWFLYRRPDAASRALWFSEADAPLIPGEIGRKPPAAKGVPLKFSRLREDRFSIRGQVPSDGWVFLSEPLGPGWVVPRSGRRALGAFWMFPVKSGEASLDFVYAPVSFCAGLSITLLALSLFSVIVYGNFLRFLSTRHS